MAKRSKPGPKPMRRDEVATEHIAVSEAVKRELERFGATYNVAVKKLIEMVAKNGK